MTEQTFFSVTLGRVSSKFQTNQLPMLKEMISNNLNAPDYPEDFDCALLSRYEQHSALLGDLNSLPTPSIGHVVKVLCSNGREYEQAMITNKTPDTLTICVNGGGFIHSEKLKASGLAMSITGGYSLKVPLSCLVDLDEKVKAFKFSGTGRIEAHCGISISRSIKRWSLDDSNDVLGFY